MILLTARTPEGCAVARDAAEEHGKGVWVRWASCLRAGIGNVGSGRGPRDGIGGCGYGCGSEPREMAGWDGAWGGGKAPGPGTGYGNGYAQGWADGRGDGVGEGRGQ